MCGGVSADLVDNKDEDWSSCERDDGVVMTFFTKMPGDVIGTTVWMGVTSLHDLEKSLRRMMSILRCLLIKVDG